MTTPTPGRRTARRWVGPVVISEIMYPPVADAGILELANITDAPVTLQSALTGDAWKFTQGITHVFPHQPGGDLAAREKILWCAAAPSFAQNYTPAVGTRVFQWTSGGLDNNGETLELAMPGDTNNVGVRQFIRVDRVDFTDTAVADRSGWQRNFVGAR